MNIGVIAGEGRLPLHVVEGAREAGHPVCVAQLEGAGEASRFGVAAQTFPIANLGALTRWLRDQGATHVSFAGRVSRPDFARLKPDMRGLKHLPRIVKAARRGDDALLQALITVFEAEGFAVVAPQGLAANLLAPEGTLGRVEAPPGAREDLIKACKIAREMGRLDIGQAAVVAGGVVLGVEAQEGTDGLLRRIVRLPEAVRGTPDMRFGVLAKMVKPGQDSRIDLPTIGPATVELAGRAGLAGIVIEAGRAFVIDREEMLSLADEAGVFVLGLPKG